MRGKKVASETVSALFTTSLEAEFPDVFGEDDEMDAADAAMPTPSSKKRSRLSTGDEAATLTDSAEKILPSRKAARGGSEGRHPDEEQDGLSNAEKVKV
jgi:hypothetical protein